MIFAFSTVSDRDTITRPSRSSSARRRLDRIVLPDPMTAVSATRRPLEDGGPDVAQHLCVVIRLIEAASIGGRARP